MKKGNYGSFLLIKKNMLGIQIVLQELPTKLNEFAAIHMVSGEYWHHTMLVSLI